MSTRVRTIASGLTLTVSAGLVTSVANIAADIPDTV